MLSWTEPGSCLWLLTDDFLKYPLISCLNFEESQCLSWTVTALVTNQLTRSSDKKMSNTEANWFRRIGLFWMRQSTLGPMRQTDGYLSFYSLCNVLKAEVRFCQVQDLPNCGKCSCWRKRSKATPGLICSISPDTCMKRKEFMFASIWKFWK